MAACFTGRQAAELKLVDQVGDESTAIAWLAKSRPCEERNPDCIDSR